MIEREGNSSTKQENTTDTTTNTTSSTTSWSRFKDPRIVRVSRAFGGKDRHSKVCTVRGLRDRRVRLSVPTAIQLYDLQDRLGLNQPSKVVDWLLNAAKQEIDGLPPLQFPILTPHNGFIVPNSQSAKHGLKISPDFNWNDNIPASKHHHPPRVFSGEASGRNDDHDPYNFLSSRQQNQNPSSFSSLLAPFNSWDPSNLTLSQPPISLGLTAQHDQELDNFTLGSHHQHPQHFLVYQPTQPYFPFESKQPGFHSSDLSDSNSAQPVRPFRFSNEQNKHDELHSS